VPSSTPDSKDQSIGAYALSGTQASSQQLLLELQAALPAIHQRLLQYLHRFYYLSVEDEDLSVPRFVENPVVVLSLLSQHVNNAAADPSKVRESVVIWY